ncbi:Benzoylformate decarboxylase-like protein [Emericellopsis cladophorae]|uniref:Benzoylformate decarboxylase-like protein n=1 Tax=Emericellopsis cladophorae TaxID=2686198 RepID=A0A9P9Y2Q0_9HYPO|nr:Benzoylformate decarboxylase-like protein [Emericellopsis cladophorae]KAI6782503.1 Benzoylformate decarboxylase-like protein [Emericellopsis cladophorae]
MPRKPAYTASTAFFEALAAAGVSHAFVNLGSDHPAIMEAIVRSQRDPALKHKFPRIITCPSEMVAMSMADGYARVTGEPQVVIVHVDVGTQALGVAVHNASVGRCPVLVFAGLSPFTCEGELPGSRTEFIHWLQDVPDQKAILGQYCRYAAEVKTPLNIKQMVNRALQFTRSDPAGPAYLVAAREVMEAEMEPYTIQQDHWRPVEMGALPGTAALTIAQALASASRPLVITGYSGRNLACPAQLVALADAIPALQVLDGAGSDMSFPSDHPACLGIKQGQPDDAIPQADVILVLHCDVPWVPTLCKPRDDARIFHVDIDPLKQGMPLFYIPAEARYRADALATLEQLNAQLTLNTIAQPSTQVKTQQAQARQAAFDARLDAIRRAAQPHPDGSFGTGFLSKTLATVCPDDTIWAVEAVTNSGHIHSNVRPTAPGHWINCGGGGLGWSGGAALGIKLATDKQGKAKFVCQVVGDGTYLFSVPGSVYWISRRYNIPVLTVVLNNKGWNAPRVSLQLLHPDGEGAQVSNEDLNISFHPTPDYAGIARAAGAGDIHAFKVTQASELEAVLRDAVDKVKAGTTAVVDARVIPGS